MSLPKIRLERCVRLSGGMWRLDEAQARHLVRSLRSYDGAAVEGLLEDGGVRMLMRLESKGENSFLREVKVESEPEDRLAMTLMIGLLKSEQFDAVLRASSELGLKSILPVACERSVPRVAELDIRKKVSRWQKILDEGTSVSGALSPPKITAPIKFTEVEWDLLPKKRYAAVIASESRPISSVDDLDGEIVFAVGPEGDWSERESESLLEHGFIPVALGCRIMRASTAAITGCGWFRFMSGHDIFR